MAQGQFVRVVNQPQLLALAFGAMVGWSWVALSGTWIAGAGLLGGPWAGNLLVVGGIAGILTSWNAFLIGGSRALDALGVVLLVLSRRRSD